MGTGGVGEPGAGRSEEKDFDQILKETGACPPQRPKLGTKRDGVLELSGGSIVDCICLFCDRVTSVVDLFRLCRTTLARVLMKPFLSLWACLNVWDFLQPQTPPVLEICIFRGISALLSVLFLTKLLL